MISKLPEKPEARSDALKHLYSTTTLLLSLLQKIELREITKKAIFKFNQQLFAARLKKINKERKMKLLKIKRGNKSGKEICLDSDDAEKRQSME